MLGLVAIVLSQVWALTLAHALGLRVVLILALALSPLMQVWLGLWLAQGLGLTLLVLMPGLRLVLALCCSRQKSHQRPHPEKKMWHCAFDRMCILNDRKRDCRRVVSLALGRIAAHLGKRESAMVCECV